MFDRILCLQSMLQITTLYNHDKNEANYCILNEILYRKITRNKIANAIRKA